MKAHILLLCDQINWQQFDWNEDSILTLFEEDYTESHHQIENIYGKHD